MHRMVAELFIPNPKSLPTVNHKNGDKTDNRVENLEWMTYKDNSKHFFGGPRSWRGAKHHRTSLSEDDAIDIRCLNFLFGVSQKKLTAIYGHCVQAICEGRTWTHV